MQQTTEIDRVKSRIRALTEKTVSNGCTEAEALAAAEMVGRLLDRYCLTMAEIDLRQTPCVELTVFSGARKRRPIDACVTAIARFCDTKVWLVRTEDGVSYVFFGFETDAMLARYLFQVIDSAIATESEAFRARNPGLRDLKLRRSADSFRHGMAARIAERLELTQVERATAMAAQRSGGTALTVVKHQVVEAAFNDSGTRLAASRRPAIRILRGAYSDGVAAGERVNLARPLNGGSPASLK